MAASNGALDGLVVLDLSAYFMAANRNKHSIAVDLSPPDSQRIVADLAAWGKNPH